MHLSAMATMMLVHVFINHKRNAWLWTSGPTVVGLRIVHA